jgi:aerobic carbon-monoxide dehydrogenase medium subunit
MDLPPVLMALGASITIVGPEGERGLPVEELFSGYYETVLAKNELIASVHVPAQRSRQAAYIKVTTGSADDWPALGIAAVIEGNGDAVTSARLVASAATEKAARLKAAEAILSGHRLDETLLRRAADAAVDESEFIADVRGSVPYKRELMRVYVRRAVQAAWAETGRNDGHA